MKIGIITMWNASDNYGGILQTFALQKYLRDLGHDAYDIRFSPKSGWGSKTKKAFKKILFMLHLYHLNKLDMALKKAKKRKIDLFRKGYIALSDKEYHSLNEIQTDYPEADIYITGSDQVWAGSLEKKHSFNRIFFLDFGLDKTKRISYAASFGHDFFPCGDGALFSTLVRRFDKVSVRENNGINICQKFGINAIKCVDSTFLLEADVYKSMMTPRKHDCKYAYFYTVNVSSKDEIYWEKLRDFFNKFSIESIVTTATGYKAAEEIFDGAIYDYSTVQEWLANIYYSEVVLTASFHGVIFSILFNKDFVYFPLKGKLRSGNDRITDLLSECGLEDRKALSVKDAQQLVFQTIDYSNLNNRKLKNMINLSRDFLKFE